MYRAEEVVAAKQAADVGLHSMKCSCTEAKWSVHADAREAHAMADPMKTQYRGSNFIGLRESFAGQVLKDVPDFSESGTGQDHGQQHLSAGPTYRPDESKKPEHFDTPRGPCEQVYSCRTEESFLTATLSRLKDTDLFGLQQVFCGSLPQCDGNVPED